MDAPRQLLVSLAVVVASIFTHAQAARAADSVHECIEASTAAQTDRNRGALLAARKGFVGCADERCPAIVRSHCARWLTEVEPRIPSVAVRAVGPRGEDLTAVELRIDGALHPLDGRPVPLDPGEHVMGISIASGPIVEQKILLREGEGLRQVTLRAPDRTSSIPPLSPPTADDGSSSHRHDVPIGAWVVSGAGGLALATSAYFAVAASNDLDALKGSCSPHCTSAQTESGRTHALVADVALGTGIAGVTGGVVWALLSQFSHASRSFVRIDVAPRASGAGAAVTVIY